MNRPHPKHPLLLTLLLLIAASLFAAAPAQAQKNQRTVIEDPGRLFSHDPAVRDASLDETAALGAQIVKVSIHWRSIAPEGTATRAPAGDLSNPDQYPAGSWDQLAGIVAGAQTRGLTVWFSLSGPAPRWAVARETSPGLGAYKPNATHYGRFVKAVGRRFPSVHMFSIWNEPNLKRFLQPQKQGGIVMSAVHYRSMYTAARSALRSSGHAKDTILFGELMPRSPARVDPQFTAPLVWLREFFCIDRRGKALRGKVARRHKCNGFKKISTSGLAYHPYRLSGSPTDRETKSKDYAAINYMPRVQKVLDAATKAKHLAQRKLKIYNSEYGFQSNPPDPIGTPISKVPGYLNISEYLNWSDPRVATYSQYLLVDDFDLGAFQTGLRFNDWTPKPKIYEAFQTPALAMRTRSRNRVQIWGGLRAKGSGTEAVEIQFHDSSGWHRAKTLPVHDKRGYFSATVARSGAQSLAWRLVWSGGVSRTVRAVSPVKPRRD